MILAPPESRSLWRFYFLGACIAAALCVLLAALCYRQLIQGEEWTEQMAQSTTRVVCSPAPRGKILDRNGVVLVDNRPSYNVALYLDEFGAGRNKKKLLSRVRESVNTLRQRMKMSVRVNDQVVRVHYDRRGPLPLTVWNDLSPAALAAFEERSPWQPGVDLDIEPVRAYPFGDLACHVLGYVGKPESASEDEDYDLIGRRAFAQPSVVGKSGIEASMDKVLTGTQGQRVIRLDAAGLKESETQNAEPTPGNNVVLSLDADIQAIVEEAFTGYRGACVILDPNNGDILAMASMPSYNPNLFIPAIRRVDWQALTRDVKQPMLNRAIQGSYSPGSSFKPIVALAALNSGLVKTTDIVECTGSFSLGANTWHCWDTGGHGDMNMREALTMSCNVFFYTMGYRLGGPPLWRMAGAFGLGKPTGIPLDHEEGGILPTDDWKRARNPRDRWTSGDAVNMAIGQGLLNVTPLQMAVVAAALANGGTVFKPRLVLRVETSEGDPLTEFPPETHARIPATPESIQFVREAMVNVVENGTGKSAALPNLKIAGKTGSAQFKERDPATGAIIKQTRAWMISFAPFHEPRYAMAIVAEGGESGGHTAGPIVGKIYKKLLQLDRERHGPHRPTAVAALPVTEKIAGFEGEVSGELLGAPPPAPAPAPSNDEGDSEPPPAAFPAEKVDLP